MNRHVGEILMIFSMIAWTAVLWIIDDGFTILDNKDPLNKGDFLLGITLLFCITTTFGYITFSALMKFIEQLNSMRKQRFFVFRRIKKPFGTQKESIFYIFTHSEDIARQTLEEVVGSEGWELVANLPADISSNVIYGVGEI